MKSVMFDEIVEKRANERANARIRDFKTKVMSACLELVNRDRRLGGLDGMFPTNQAWHREVKAVLTILCSDDTRKGWPKRIWDEEREAVKKNELLSIMDEMQRALIAPAASEDDEQPAEE